MGAWTMEQEAKEYQYSQILDILAEMVTSYITMNSEEKPETE